MTNHKKQITTALALTQVNNKKNKFQSLANTFGACYLYFGAFTGTCYLDFGILK